MKQERRREHRGCYQYCHHCGQLALTPAGNPCSRGRNWCLRVLHPPGKGAELFTQRPQHSLMDGGSWGGRRSMARVTQAAAQQGRGDAGNRRKPAGKEMQVLADDSQSSTRPGGVDEGAGVRHQQHLPFQHCFMQIHEQI